MKTKRQAVLISAIVFIVLPPLASLFSLGLPLYDVTVGHKMAFWSIGSSLVTALFPVTLIVAYLKWPLRLNPAYWLIPLYLGLEGVDGLIGALVRWRVQTNIGGAWVQSVLYLLFAFMLWYYRPGPASSDEVLTSSDEGVAQPS